ncbi:MAG: hypothetical protein IPJ88_16045 [Myxococcales bacterium]|nr:MAG: hypothetical protein IPJ88_16045 [Myxococcales bacterium]
MSTAKSNPNIVSAHPSQEEGSEVAPTGTWSGDNVPENQGTAPEPDAQDASQQIAISSQVREKTYSEVPGLMPDEEQRAAEATQSQSKATPSKKKPVAPPQPLLASTLLLDDFAPKEPGQQLIRRSSIAVGILGTAAALALSRAEPGPLVVAAIFAIIGAIGAFKLSYAHRAWALTVLSFVSLGFLSWVRSSTAGLYSGPWLGLGVAVLCGSLLFRAYYRSALTSRILVGASVIVTAGWLAIATQVESISVLEIEWQSWAKPVLWLVLSLLLLLSLLSFMEAQTTGGCRIWATCLLLWYPAYVFLELALRTWPAQGGAVLISQALRTLAPASSVSGEFQISPELSTLSVSLLCALAALGLWQLLAVHYTRSFRGRRDDISLRLMSNR